MIDAAHALYAPSGASRWIPCNGSVRTPAPPQETNDAAKFGTEVHEWIANGRCGVLGHWTNEQIDNAEKCAEAWLCHTPSDAGFSEIRLCSKRWPKLLFGTLDKLWFDSSKVANLNDLKTGLKSVSAVNNLQMKVYSYLVAVNFPEVEQFNTKIIQPLRNYVGSHTYTRDELTAFEAEIATAIESGTTFNPGSHCEYCPNRDSCVDLAKALFGLLNEAKDGQLCSDPNNLLTLSVLYS